MVRCADIRFQDAENNPLEPILAATAQDDDAAVFYTVWVDEVDEGTALWCYFGKGQDYVLYLFL